MHGVDSSLALEWPLTGHGLVEQATEGEDVRSMVDPLALHLFGRHIADGPHDRSFGRLLPGHGRNLSTTLFGQGLGQLGEAEIQHLGIAVAGDHDVVGLEIAVDDALGVGLGEPLRRLAEPTEQVLGRGLVDMDLSLERRAVDALHGDEVDARR